MVYYQPNCIYFLTGSTFMHFPYFKNNKQKEILLNQLKKFKEKTGVSICAYSIQINHYHLLFRTKSQNDVTMAKQFLHGGTSFLYKKQYPIKYGRMWGSVITYKILKESDYWGIVGYICGNMLKHKEVNDLYELDFNQFSSYTQIKHLYGKEFIDGLICRVIGVVEDSNMGIDLKEVQKLSAGIPTPAKAG